MATIHKLGDDSPCWYDDQVSFMPDMDSPRRISHHHHPSYHPHNFHPHHIYHCKQELELPSYNISHHDPFLQLPQLESPKMPQASMSCSSMAPYGQNANLQSSTLAQNQLIHSQPLDSMFGNTNGSDQVVDQVTDWRVLDKFVASQLSQDEHGPHPSSKESNYSNAPIFPVSQHMSVPINPTSNEQDPGVILEYASTSTSSCQIDLWK